MRLPHRLNLQLPLPPLRRHQVDGAPSLVQLRLKCGSGASSGRFATPSGSARGTDRDIPASFPRS